MSAPWIVWGKYPNMSKKIRRPVVAVAGPVVSDGGLVVSG